MKTKWKEKQTWELELLLNENEFPCEEHRESAKSRWNLLFWISIFYFWPPSSIYEYQKYGRLPVTLFTHDLVSDLYKYMMHENDTTFE